ncbi:AbrB family transcriptional regulator [Streptomyces sp. DSM 42041]|uniref:AbrB family transcriptional regulator n=1 Tax=Streptomyces hazeniae TaxID=3075538 RepID=A0ABU2NMH2_9ACTN|nr:AbrB family transcriptional regulator [Streptomyces sp. DSM 42041]MDT0378176.1 AbrB family transcriptional regulator [Streptomyces sp. DSM 42041]
MTQKQGWLPDAGRIARVLAGALAGALLFTVLRVPAGTVVGSVVGSALVNRWRPAAFDHRLPVRALRTVGMVLLGCVAGARLDAETLRILAGLALPLLGGVALLLLLEMLLAALLIVRHGVDPVTAVLAFAPGGLSEISLTAQDMGARMSLVLAVHMARVLAVVLLVLPLLVAWAGAS